MKIGKSLKKEKYTRNFSNFCLLKIEDNFLSSFVNLGISLL